MRTAANLPQNFFGIPAVKTFLTNMAELRVQTNREVFDSVLTKMESRYRMTTKTEKLSESYITVSFGTFFYSNMKKIISRK